MRRLTFPSRGALAAAAILILAGPTAALAQEEAKPPAVPGPSFKEVQSLSSISSPRISPAGDAVDLWLEDPR